MSPYQSRSAATVFGALIGDAAGGVLEFMGRQPTPHEVENAMQMPGGGTFGLAPGQFTDDGEMTVTLLRSLALENGTYTHDRVAKAYAEWEQSSPFDIGTATRSALRVFRHDLANNGIGYARCISDQALRHNAGSKANGSMMRATPLAIAGCRLTLEETIGITIRDVQLTHPNVACLDSTVAYVIAIRHLILNPGDSQGAISLAKNHAESKNEEVRSWIGDAMDGNLPDAVPQAGFVKYAFTYAFHSLHNRMDFSQAIKETLVKGGDTDTNACIVGGLMGAFHGMDGLPATALNKIMTCKTKHGQPRPENYTARHVTKYLETLNKTCLSKN